MITKIFYSLVLFPKIQFHKEIKSGFFLLDIEENNFWKLETVFKKWNTLEKITFCHKDFVEKEIPQTNKTKNWHINWKNQELLKEIYKIILKTDSKDFNFFKNSKFYNKIPFWTVLTITSKCNLFCNYCFNDYDYPLKERNTQKNLNLEKYKEIIDILYKSGTRDIILTWGEPFTCPFLWKLLDYLKEKNIFTRINTNWSLLSEKTLERLNNNYSINLMVSMHEFNNKDYYEINKKWAKNIYKITWIESWKNKYEKKVKNLKKISPLNNYIYSNQKSETSCWENHINFINGYKNITLDFLTILTPKNILYLEKLYKYILGNFKIENWHFFRLYSTRTTKWISKEMINLAIHKLYKLNKKYNTNYKIVDSVPFCVTKDTEIAKEIIDWELSKNHNIKTIITTTWDIQIMSAFDSSLWNILKDNLLEIWQWDYVQKMLNNWFLPKECDDCKYKNECRWGSRMDANIYNGSYNAFDPLGKLENKLKICSSRDT